MLSHGFMLASSNALYWDDWLTYAGGRQGTVDYFAQCTRCVVPFRGEIEGLLIDPGPWLMRLPVFVFFPIIALLTQQFLRRTKWLQRDEETLVTLALLFLPMFGARIALTNFQYSFSLLLFTLGAWMTLSQRRLTRLASLLPIFWSMFIASFQVFVLVVLAVLVVRLLTKSDVLGSDRVVLLGSLLVFPFVHRYLIPRLLPELSVTDGYNTIRGAFLARAVMVSAILIFPLVIVTLRWFAKRTADRPTVFIAVGLALLSVGTFPYLAVGHFPNLSDWVLPFLPDQSDWNSRHQLLQPFGIAVVVCGIQQTFVKNRRGLLVLLLASSIFMNLATYSGYYLDWSKQRSVMAYLAQNADSLTQVEAMVVRDSANDFNARGRGVRSYEWEAMFTRATGRTVRIDSDSIEYCFTESPTAILKIVPTGGRLISLLRREAAVNVSLERLDGCVPKK
jgi:hypothetical protein